MSLIKKDEIGVYFISGLTVVRPLTDTTYTRGRNVRTHHFTATPFYGVGKTDDCGHGIYLERWISAGAAKNLGDLQYLRNTYLFYLEVAKEFEGITDPSIHMQSIRHKHIQFLEKDKGPERFEKIGYRVKTFLKNKRGFDRNKAIQEIQEQKTDLICQTTKP